MGRFDKSIDEMMIKFFAKVRNLDWNDLHSWPIRMMTYSDTTYSDTIFGVRCDHTSEGDFIILIYDKNILGGTKVHHLTMVQIAMDLPILIGG